MDNQKKDNKKVWAVGGGLLLGLGVGFFLLPNGLAFVGSIFAGLGLGLIVTAVISKS